jgi:hypothetical protein
MAENTDNMFEYPIPEADTGTPDTSNEEVVSDETSTPEEGATKEPVEKKPDNNFDYADDIEKMEADASISDDDSESDADDGDDTPADESEKKPETNSGDQKSEPTDEQLFQAAQLGLTYADVKGLDGRGLSTAIRMAEKLKPAETPDKGDEEQADSLFKPIALDGLDDFDEDTQGLVKGLQDQFNANMQTMADELKKAQDQLGNSQEATLRQNQDRFEQEFSKSIVGLGEEWADVFGTDRDSASQAQFDSRMKLIEEMDRLSSSHKDLGLQGLFDTAMRVSFSEEINTKREQKKKKSRSDHRQDRTTARPSQRNRSIENMPDGRDKAIASVKEKGKKGGFFANMFS